jgi:hypothetical protein
MKTKVIPEQKIDLYEFAELTPDIQQHVLNTLYDINVDYNWWDSTYEDAANIGLKITGFDLDRGSYCKGSFINTAIECAEAIIREHGEECETYKTASKYLANLIEVREKYKNAGEDNWDEESELENTEDEFLNDLLEDYRIILQHEYDYLTSKEAIIEIITANEYLFTIDGKIETL